ncbi:MAG: hypothetical protein MRECE_28c020 [Mycoplasmataceae bacterium CE_OT135]|nr:MAG: hypothetical protein MRECE_28c020 [Mycoplasmataceae bacterium CE_OT135]
MPLILWRKNSSFSSPQSTLLQIPFFDSLSLFHFSERSSSSLFIFFTLSSYCLSCSFWRCLSHSSCCFCQ